MARQPKQTIETRLPRNYEFRIAESVSAIASVVGIVAALATQKILWVAVPLTASILINLHNRRKLNALSHQYALLGLSHIQQSLQNDLNNLQGRLQHHKQSDGQPKQAELQGVITMLTETLGGLETKLYKSSDSNLFSNLTADIRALKVQVGQYQHRLTTLDHQWQNHTVLHSAHVHQLETVKIPVEPKSRSNVSGPQSLAHEYPQLFHHFSTDLSALQDQIQSLAFQVKQHHQLDSDALKRVPVHRLHAQISTLSMQMKAKKREWSTQFVAYQASMAVLQKSLNHIQEQLIDVQTMAASADQTTMTALSTPMHIILTPLQLQYIDLSNRFDHLSFETGVTQSQSRQLQRLTEQVSAIQFKILTITNEDLTSSIGDEVLP